MFDPVSDSSKNRPAAAFIQAIEKEYEQNSRHGYSWHMSDAQAKMSPEEREVEHDRRSKQTDIQSAIEYFFREVVEHAPKSTYLIALPIHMAQDMNLGSNVLIRYILSLPYRTSFTEEDKEIVTEIRSMVVAPRCDPGIREVIHSLIRNAKTDTTYTLGEFYWLYQLCNWLGCLEGTMTMYFDKLLGLNGDNIPNLDFRKKITNEVEDMKEILMAMRIQYNKLSGLLKSI